MSGSLSSWLALREPADAAARSETLTRAIADALPRERPLRILDLGTGAGSNVRYLAPRLPSPQQWLAVDADASLLSELKARTRVDGDIRTRQMDLGRIEDTDIFAARHLVTASALLDLVSESWLHALARACRSAGAAVLFALTYNGESRCAPAEPQDDFVRELMNRHQKQNDKGFGRAAGPGGADCAERAFKELGYHVVRERTDWVLPPSMREMQQELVEGWVEAAVEMAPDKSTSILDWRSRRLAHIAANRSHILVGHYDLAGWVRSHE